MPNTQPNQNNNQSSGQTKSGFGQDDKVGNNIRKDEPTAKQASDKPQGSGQRAGGGM